MIFKSSIQRRKSAERLLRTMTMVGNGRWAGGIITYWFGQFHAAKSERTYERRSPALESDSLKVIDHLARSHYVWPFKMGHHQT